MMRREIVQLRRKREGRTDYRKRLRLLVSKIPRLVVRKSNAHLLLQIISYDAKGDRVLASSTTRELSKLGWKSSSGNIPAAYACGLLLAKNSRGKVEECIVDLGVQAVTKGNRLFAAVKGARDGGLKVRVGDENLPSDDRCNGIHVKSHKDSIPLVIDALKKGLKA